jgi:hypothetical protein
MIVRFLIGLRYITLMLSLERPIHVRKGTTTIRRYALRNLNIHEGTNIEYILVLDERIDEMAEQVKSHYHLDDIGDPSSMTEVWEPMDLNFDHTKYDTARTIQS